MADTCERCGRSPVRICRDDECPYNRPIGRYVRVPKQTKALCPSCGVCWVEGADKPEHEDDCPFPPDSFPVVVFRPLESVTNPDAEGAENG